jgi:hypothetical protein
MIVDAQKIYINGTVYPVYAVDFSNNGSTSPSTLDLKFVNQTGVYQHPTKTTKNVTTIKIGNFFTFYGYPVSSTISKSSSGNVLTVKYTDTSIILDKYYIGLKGVYGDGFDTVAEGFSPNIILVGEQVDPCAGLQANFDNPCNPCQSTSVGLQVPGDILTQEGAEKRYDCEKQKTLQILDVVYKFRDLLNAVKARINNISFSNVPSFLDEDKYYARHTGTLREVLNKWCQEYNITYIWNNGKIKFIDLKNGIEINDTNVGVNCQIIDTSETETIEENSSYGTISYFGLNGELKKEQCGSNEAGVTRLSLIPITIRDILGTAIDDSREISINWTELGYPSITSSPLLKNEEEEIEFFLALLAIGKVSELARDLFILRYMYNFFEKLKDSPDTLANKVYPEVGIELYDRVPSTDSNLGMLLESSNNMNSDSLARRGHKRDDYVFFKARDISNYHLKEFEEGLRDRFIGKYWIRSIRSNGFQYSSPDGNPKTYQSSPDVENPGFLLDISNIIPDGAKIINAFIKSSINKDGNTVNRREDRSAVVLERTGVWGPLSNDKSLSKFNEVIYNIQCPYEKLQTNKKINNPSGNKDKSSTDNGVQYFCFYKPKPEELKVIELDGPIVERPHPIEQKNIIVTQSNFSTTYGLRSNACKTFTLAKGTVRFYTPVQCWDYGKNFAGYTVFREVGSVSNTYYVGLKKKEYVLTKVPQLDDLSLSLRINYRDVTQQFLQLLQKGTMNKCEYSLDAIRLLVADFSRAMLDPPMNPKNKIMIRRDYSLSGFPDSFFTIEDGLNSISLRYSSDSGWSSQLSFSSIPQGTRSENLLSKDFERTWMQTYGAKTFKSGVKNIL